LYCDAAISRRGFKTKHVHEDLRQLGGGASSAAVAYKEGSLSSLSSEKKRKSLTAIQESHTSVETSSQGSTSSVEGNGDEVAAEGGKSTFSEEGSHPKKQKTGQSLRMKELKKTWMQMLEEARHHGMDGSDADLKRKEWLEKCETIYDEYATLSKHDFPSED
jgi:hypothetical protein